MGNNRIQHYSKCTDMRRRRLGEPWAKHRGTRTEKDVKPGSVIKGKNGKSRAGKMCYMSDYFKELQNQRENSEQELPNAVEEK